LERAGAHAAADVAQRAQPFFDVSIDLLRRLRFRRGRGLRGNLLKRTIERVRKPRIRCRQIVRLSRIRLEVVQLAERRGDELVPSIANSGQLAPTVVIPRIPALGEGQQLETLTTRGRRQRRSLYGGWRRNAERIEDRRHH